MSETMVQKVDELVKEGQQRFANAPTSTDAGAMVQLASYVGGIHQALRALAEEVDALKAQRNA